MDAAEIAEMVKDLKLSKEADGDGVVITKEEERRGNERLAKTVVGKIFARRQVNKEVIKTHIPQILRTRGGMEIEMIGHNLFAISFALGLDKRAALEDGPWHFFQDLMIIKETDPMQTVAGLEFTEIIMWIQCHNVPMACMEPEILKKIGSKVGTVEEIDLDEGGISLGKTVRMRVRRNLDIPLVRCVPVNKENNQEETIVIIQYEKLPHFCFACGRIGHIIKDCEDEKVDKTNMRYDHRLRASTNSNFQNQRSWGVGRSRSGGVGTGKGLVRQRLEVEDVENGKESDGEVEGNEEERESQLLLTEKGVGEGEGFERESLADERMEEDGEGEEVKGCGTVNNLNGEEGEIESEGGTKKGLISPGKKKKKTGGRGWKKRAREVVLETRKEGETERLAETDKGGRKRGGLELEEDDQTPVKRLTKTNLVLVTVDGVPAEAAVQPRRTQ